MRVLTDQIQILDSFYETVALICSRKETNIQEVRASASERFAKFFARARLVASSFKVRYAAFIETAKQSLIFRENLFS